MAEWQTRTFKGRVRKSVGSTPTARTKTTNGDYINKMTSDENKSELPILMFRVDETLTMPEFDHDWVWENVYYFPDLDCIKYIRFHSKNASLPKTIDLRDKFQDLGVPESLVFYRSVEHDCRDKAEQAAARIKSEIEALYNSGLVHSWDDLAKYYKNQNFENE